ncbi:hypothetical protein [Sorangium sp. So ce1078]|uniref:hypothetical protein n=1 Tax=Sorangium sp. So ce1078 TaxID=3133329 RepID=UPI003F638B84
MASVQGGSSFLSHLNLDRPLDYLKIGDLSADLTDGRFAPLTPAAARELKARLHDAGQDGGVDEFLYSRSAEAKRETGRFSAGSGELLAAAQQSRPLEERLRAVDLPPAGGEDLPQALGLIGECFRRGIVQCALVDLTGAMALDEWAHLQRCF